MAGWLLWHTYAGQHPLGFSKATVVDGFWFTRHKKCLGLGSPAIVPSRLTTYILSTWLHIRQNLIMVRGSCLKLGMHFKLFPPLVSLATLPLNNSQLSSKIVCVVVTLPACSA